MQTNKKQKQIRIAFLIIMDIIMLFLSYFFAFWLVYSLRAPFTYIQQVQWYLMVAILLKIVVFYISGMYNTLWRYASIEELWQIVMSVAIACGVELLFFKISGVDIPNTVWVLDGVFSLLAIGAVRMVYRTERSRRQMLGVSPTAKNVLIVGAGEAGIKILRELATAEEPSNVVGFIDDDKYKQKQKINSYKVLGPTEDIPTIVKENAVNQVIIALPSTAKRRLNVIADIAHGSGVDVKMLPSFEDILNYDVSLSRLRPLQIEDLLERGEIHLDKGQISSFIRDKVVLVTGGAGSIGSELCRQIIRFHPKRLVILDIYENTLYYLQLELTKFVAEVEKKSGAHIDIDLEICSIRDEVSVNMIFDKYRPQMVFHAAAHKHVPLMEKTPKEAIKNNVFGTLNVLKACDTYGALKYVQISTDKAVRPTNVMGTTKRICEMLVQEFNQKSKTDYVAVRFGNVLGSNGSVIPIFKEQILNGGPVTVTDERITRFFMTIPEATQLVLQAGSIAHGGEIFVLDMGEPVEIKSLAEKMICLYGYEPYTEMPIVFTGLR